MRLIDADKCISEIKNNIHIYGHEHVQEGLQRAISFINHTTTFDPVKHGYWIIKGNGNADCSCCGYRSSRVYDDDNADRYCRHCGAKMDT